MGIAVGSLDRDSFGSGNRFQARQLLDKQLPLGLQLSEIFDSFGEDDCLGSGAGSIDFQGLIPLTLERARACRVFKVVIVVLGGRMVVGKLVVDRRVVPRDRRLLFVGTIAGFDDRRPRSWSDGPSQCRDYQT